MAVDRTSDERVLRALALRLRGETWAQIAARLGYSRYTAAQTACANVRKADERESGEDCTGGYA